MAGRRLNGKSGRPWLRSPPCKLLVLPGLVLTAFFLGAVAIAGIVVYTRGSQDHSGGADTGKKKVFNLAGELNGLVPEFEVKPVVFGKDALATSDHKTEASANATEENWRSYMPAGQGFIAVDNPSQYTLPQAIEFHDQAVYFISVFHQLHCLTTASATSANPSSAAATRRWKDKISIIRN
ncbi:hypothetical protein N0V85_009069 [Neurospora sp. IMI 360204]|nr:hypothetical protein N0V85_009069 [Neurospora sp. IMI 360204]